MNTQNSPVDHDECLSLFANLGRLAIELGQTEAPISGNNDLCAEVAQLRQELDTAIQLRSWAQPNVLESVEDLYATALGNTDTDIAAGLVSYLDYLSGVQVPSVSTVGKGITFGIVCAADVTRFEEIGAFSDVGPLRSWIASHLAVSEASITVHPTPGVPDTIFEGLYEFTAELGRAMNEPLPEEYTWSVADEGNLGNASDIVFWVNFSSNDTEELQRVANLIGSDLPDEKMALMTLPFQTAFGTVSLEIFPCAVMWPFSALAENVFNPILDALEYALNGLNERGFSPDTIAAVLSISLEEDNLYGFDESFVIDLRDAATGYILARVPGFHAGMAKMFVPVYVEAAKDFHCASTLVRPGKGEPDQFYERGDE